MSADNLFRAVSLFVLMFAFLGMVKWAWSKDRKQDFEQMEQLPLAEDSEVTDKAE